MILKEDICPTLYLPNLISLSPSPNKKNETKAKHYANKNIDDWGNKTESWSGIMWVNEVLRHYIISRGYEPNHVIYLYPVSIKVDLVNSHVHIRGIY
ncbi:hypothetical protein RIR_jg29204.t1 [Rhizophagus irregularis DAOM 181602=DAOM 197198]|nr:hypothetical protein RIR_jg29204.t1 [Rhizophagus irregularis DAOM 181602=DAOM 197198]